MDADKQAEARELPEKLVTLFALAWQFYAIGASDSSGTPVPIQPLPVLATTGLSIVRWVALSDCFALSGCFSPVPLQPLRRNRRLAPKPLKRKIAFNRKPRHAPDGRDRCRRQRCETDL